MNVAFRPPTTVYTTTENGMSMTAALTLLRHPEPASFARHARHAPFPACMGQHVTESHILVAALNTDPAPRKSSTQMKVLFRKQM